MDNLTIQFIPYSEIEGLSSAKRVHKLIDLVKQNKIVVLEGRLKDEEEKDLIEITMENISKSFKGIEVAVINPKKEYSGIEKIKKDVFNFILGDRVGLTVVGPATIVKEIKKNPDKLEILLGKKKKVK